MLALFYNAHRGSGPAKGPEEFNPYEQGRPKQAHLTVSLKQFAELVTGKKL